MERFRKILVSVDATDLEEAPHSLLRALKLAQATGASLHIVHVIQPHSPLVRRFLHNAMAVDHQLRDQRERQLNTLCQRLEYPQTTAKILAGRPFVQLIREVEAQGCDLVIRNAAGSRDHTLFFNSLDMRLMRNCPCPVWLVKPGEVVSFSRVLVAVDPNPNDEQDENLNRRILDLASSLAEWEHSTLYVVAAWDVEGEALLVSSMSPDAFQEFVDGIEASGRETLGRAIKALPNPPTREQIRYRRGMASEIITQYANEIHADVIVIGTLARLGVPAMLMGNTAERVLRQVRCAVLTLKPRGFVSPALAESAEI